MSKFFSSACNFWKSGCCGCIRNVKDKENPKTMEPPPQYVETSELTLSQPNDNHVEKQKTIKFKKEDSPPKQKRLIKVWTEEEDELLKVYYSKLGSNNWNEVAKQIPGRNASQCSQRWRRKYKPEKIRKNWTAEEDNLLLELVNKYGQNWQLISNHMKGMINRTGKQVRERYLNKLDPKISRNPFSEEEDRILLEEYKRIGRKWSEISKSLCGRPENAIKNRFYSHIKRTILKEEDINPAQDLVQDPNDFDDSNENNENFENEEVDDVDTSDHEMEIENGIIEERPELETGMTESELQDHNDINKNQINNNDNNNNDNNENNHNGVIHIENIQKLQSRKLLTNGTFENVNVNIYNCNEIQQNSGKPFEQNSGSAKMEIEDMMKQFDSQNHNMSIEERKINYDVNENYKLNVMPNFESSGGGLSYNKGFSTETDKLLRSNNTFEKMESYNSNNELEANQILKIKDSYNEEGQNNSKQEEFFVENYLNNERK